MNLKEFKVKIKKYLRLVGYSQQNLAEALGFSAFTLSHKLNNSDGAKLSYQEVKQIIKTLAEWQAINKKEEAIELLELAELGEASFSQTEWAAPPLVNLSQIKPAQSASVQASSPKHNLPIQLTNFIGRTQQLTALRQLVQHSSTRLVTLVGVGGVGKTRLALQLGQQLLQKYADGVWLIELATNTEATRLPQLIGQVLGVQNQNSLADLIRYLSSREILLILDNCEHLLEATAELTYKLLTGCPQLKILATSRETLEVVGEKCWQVPPLAFPPNLLNPASEQPYSVESLVEFEAVNLFVERATASNAQFQVSPQNAASLLQICHQLEGIPLALELASAWVKTLSLEQIAEHLNNQAQLLNSNRPRYGLADRHQTLQGLLDWSYQLLPEDQQQLWLELTIFRGGWNLAAAQAVCQKYGSFGVVQLLSQLVSKSLLVTEETEFGELRYRMLEPIRQYGRAKLELQPAEVLELLQTRHFENYLAMVEKLQSGLADTEQRKTTLARLRRDHANLRLALDWALETGNGNADYTEKILRFCQALGDFWFLQSYLIEGRSYLERALGLIKQTEQLSRAKSLLAKILYWQGTLAARQGEHEIATGKISESLELYRGINDTDGIIECLNILGNVFRRQLKLEQAMSVHEQALLVAQEHNRILAIAQSFNGLGTTSQAAGRIVKAKAYFQESLKHLQQINARHGIAAVLQNLGDIAQEEKDYELAWQHYQVSLSYWREIGDKWNEIGCLFNTGTLCKRQGRYAEAEQFYLKGATVAQEIGEKLHIAIGFSSLANLALEQRDWAKAANYYRQASQFYTELKDKVRQARTTRGLATIALAQGSYIEAERQIDESLRLAETIHNKVETALSLTIKAPVTFHCRANYSEATEALEKSLVLFQEQEDIDGIITSLGYSVVVESIAASFYSKPAQANPTQADFHLKKAAYLIGQLEILLNRHNISLTEPLLSDFNEAAKLVKAHLDAAGFQVAYNAGQSVASEENVDSLVSYSLDLK